MSFIHGTKRAESRENDIRILPLTSFLASRLAYLSRIVLGLVSLGQLSQSKGELKGSSFLSCAQMGLSQCNLAVIVLTLCMLCNQKRVAFFFIPVSVCKCFMCCCR